jgi:4-hydroxybenzoate polyprenyltransferase
MTLPKKIVKPQEFVLGFVRMVRWPNLLIMALMQYLARLFLVGPAHNWRTFWGESGLFFIVSSTLLIAAAGYIINDYFDVKIDIINKPRRVVIGRYFKRRWAMTFHQVLNMMGCGLGLLASKWVFVSCVLSATLLWFYSSYFKRKPFIGNFVVAFLAGISLLILAVYYPQNQNLVALYALFAFGITLVREIIKDMEDLRGDALLGCQTLPIVWGLRRTKQFIYFLIAIFIPTLFVAAHLLRNLYLAWVFAALLLPIGWLTYRLVYADTRREFGALSHLCKIIMLGGILSMIWI